MVKKSNLKIFSVILVIIFSLSACIIPINAESREVIIGGEAFGMKLYCKGVMVLKLESFESGNETVCPAKTAGIKINDIITKCDNKIIKSNEALSECIKSSNGKVLELEILRKNEIIYKNMKAEKDNNGYFYSGMWIRDSCAGLGTISYYDTDNMTYGALGHGICDIDTGGLMQSENGEIISASITSVSKSNSDSIGTLNGYFTNNTIGSITKNTTLGIYGKNIENPQKERKYKIADINEINIGKAYLYTTVKGTEPKKYEIEIVEICNNLKNSNRNMVVKITDENLLKKTGGIVQGMSGSPIIQNNKFIGALTHVFIEDCTMGYAISSANMIGS